MRIKVEKRLTSRWSECDCLSRSPRGRRAGGRLRRIAHHGVRQTEKPSRPRIARGAGLYPASRHTRHICGRSWTALPRILRAFRCRAFHEDTRGFSSTSRSLHRGCRRREVQREAHSVELGVAVHRPTFPPSPTIRRRLVIFRQARGLSLTKGWRQPRPLSRQRMRFGFRWYSWCRYVLSFRAGASHPWCSAEPRGLFC